MARDLRTVLVGLNGREPVPVPVKTALAVRRRAVREGREAVADALGEALGRSGVCRECGRALRDPASVAAGIGPECGPRVARRLAATNQPPKET